MLRRLMAALLLVLTLAPALAAAVPSSPDSLIPACCRRDGAHHCAMTMGGVAVHVSRPDEAPALRAAQTVCPMRSQLFEPPAPHQLAIPSRTHDHTIAVSGKTFSHAKTPTLDSQLVQRLLNRGPPVLS
jgi:hypothetical protein